MKKLVLAVAALCAAVVSQAKTTTWQGAAGGNWNVAGNWDQGIPAEGDTVVLTRTSANDLTGLSLAAIQFDGSGTYAVGGNPITVTGTAGLTVAAGVTVTNNLALTFTADQTWRVPKTGTLVLNEPFDAGSHTLEIGSGVANEMGTVVFLKGNTISGQITNWQGQLYVYHDQAFGTAPVRNNPSQAKIGTTSYEFGRFYFGNVTLANAFTIMDSNSDGDSASQAFNALANTTNTFTGKLTFLQSSMYTTVPPTAKMIWAGGLDMQNYFRCGNFKSAAGEIEFTTVPVTIKNLGYSGSYNYSGNARPNTKFSCTGNKITGEIRVCYQGRLSFGIADAIDVTSAGCFLNNMYGTVDLNGYSQHLRGFRNCYGNNGTITSAKEATLYMNQRDAYTLQSGCYRPFGGQITGKVNFSKYGSQPLTLGSNDAGTRTFTTSGYLEVTEGDLELNAKAVWQSGDVRISGSGNLILNSTANIPGTAVITFTTNETSTAKITVNESFRVARIIVNGVQLDDGSYSAANLGSLIAGTGSISAIDPSRPVKKTTWVGAAGGNWSEASNWDNGKPSTGDTVVLNRASSNDLTGLQLSSIDFQGSAAYAVGGNAVSLSGATGLVVAAGLTVTNNLALTFPANTAWLVKNEATLVLNESFDAGANMIAVYSGNELEMGNIRFLKPNVATGIIHNEQGRFYVCHDQAFGTARVENGTSQPKPAGAPHAGYDYGRFFFSGVTLANDFTIMDSNADGNTDFQVFNAVANTTNTFTGLLTFLQNSCYPTVPSTAKMIFAGGMSLGQYFRCGYFETAAGEIEIVTTPVTLRWLGYAGALNNDGNSRPNVRFSCTGNRITEQIRLCFNATMSFGVDEAIDLANSPGAFLNNLRGKVDLSGHSQHLRGFRNCSNNNGVITSASAATLSLYQDAAVGTSSAYGGQITGQVNLSKYGSSKLTLGSNTSDTRTFTTAGYLEVTEGDLELNAKAVWQSGDVRVSGSGNLILNSSANLPDSAVIRITTNETSTAKLTLNCSLQAAKILVNGEQLDDGVYTSETLGGLISGTGSIIAIDPTRPAKTTTWIGPAGGTWSQAANWDNGKPSFGDTVVLTGASDNDLIGLKLGGITYSGAGGYTVSGNAVTLVGPLTIAAAPGGDVGMNRTFTNNFPIDIVGEQTWTVGSTNTTLVLAKSVTATAKLTCAGYGSLELRADNNLAGGFYTKQNKVHAYRDASFSPDGTGTVEVYRNSASNLGQLWLHGVTLKNQINETDQNSRRCGLVSAAGTTNVLQGLLYTTSTIFPGIQTNSTLILEGGAKSEYGNLFRPCGGYDGGFADDYVIGDGNRTSWVIVRNKPLKNFQGLGYDEVCCVRFEVAGNELSANPMDYKVKYGGVTIYGTTTLVETAVPYAFNFTGGNGPIRRLSSTLDLCGCDQRVGGFTYLDNYTQGKITSAQPATLYLLQKLFQSKGGSGTVVQPLVQKVEGQVSLSKAGTNTTYLTGTKTTTGRLEVTEGDLVLDANAVWSGTSVVVAGTNTVASMGSKVVPGNLVLKAKANLKGGTILKIYGAGTVSVDAGVTASVRQLWTGTNDGNLVEIAPGDYTSANSAFVKGAGTLRVRGFGLTLFIQ